MKILFTMHAEPEANAGVAGVTFRLADALRRRGHAVDILSFGDVAGREIVKQVRFPWVVAARLRRRAGSYDVLDMTSGDGWLLTLLRRARCTRTAPLIVARSHGLEHSVHETLVQETRAAGQRLSWKYPLYHGGFRLWECAASFRHADLALFLNEPDLRYAVDRLGVPAGRAVKTRNGIGEAFIAHAERLAPLLAPLAGPHRIAFIGGYLERKGVTYLRAAMIEVLRRQPGVRIGYFGCHADRAAIVAGYPPEFHARIAVVPRFGNADLPGLLEGYTILAFPSLAEGAPLAPLEAMACGLVPVVSAIPGPLEYVTDGQNGLTVPRADHAALARQLLRLIEDPALWQRLRDAAVQTALRFSWDAIAAETEATYLQAAAQRLRG